MKKETPSSSIIADAETEAAELEQILKDVGKAIGKANERLGKSGMTFEQFKTHFLKKRAELTASHA